MLFKMKCTLFILLCYYCLMITARRFPIRKVDYIDSSINTDNKPLKTIKAHVLIDIQNNTKQDSTKNNIKTTKDTPQQNEYTDDVYEQVNDDIEPSKDDGTNVSIDEIVTPIDDTDVQYYDDIVTPKEQTTKYISKINKKGITKRVKNMKTTTDAPIETEDDGTLLDIELEEGNPRSEYDNEYDNYPMETTTIKHYYGIKKDTIKNVKQNVTNIIGKATNKVIDIKDYIKDKQKILKNKNQPETIIKNNLNNIDLNNVCQHLNDSNTKPFIYLDDESNEQTLWQKNIKLSIVSTTSDDINLVCPTKCPVRNLNFEHHHHGDISSPCICDNNKFPRQKRDVRNVIVGLNNQVPKVHKVPHEYNNLKPQLYNFNKMKDPQNVYDDDEDRYLNKNMDDENENMEDRNNVNKMAEAQILYDDNEDFNTLTNKEYNKNMDYEKENIEEQPLYEKSTADIKNNNIKSKPKDYENICKKYNIEINTKSISNNCKMYSRGCKIEMNNQQFETKIIAKKLPQKKLIKTTTTEKILNDWYDY